MPSETTGRVPSRSETTAPLPHSVGAAEVPGLSQTWLPSGMIPHFPPRSYAILTGTGVLSGAAAAASVAKLAGTGTLGGRSLATAVGILAGTGTLRGDRQVPADAKLAGTGVLSGVASARSTAILTGSGLALGVASTAVQAKLAGVGTLGGVASAAAQAKLAGGGTLSGTAANGFAPSGMTKSGTHSIGTSYAPVNGWVADTGTYPGSTVTGNGLDAQGSKPNATISTRIVCRNSFGLSTTTTRIKVNGTIVATGPGTPVGTSGTNVDFVATGINVPAGANTTLEAVDSGGSVTIATGSGYVRIT